MSNPDLAAVARACVLRGIRVEDSYKLDDAVQAALAHDGPVPLDVVTNPDEIAIPAHLTLAEGWVFAIAKVTKTLRSSGGK